MKLLKAHWAWLATSHHMRGPRVLAPSSGIHGELGALPSMVRLCLYIDFNSRYGVGQGHPVFHVTSVQARRQCFSCLGMTQSFLPK